MQFNNLELELNSGILTIKINREDKLNALNSDTIEELSQAFERVYDENDIKGVIVTGAGKKAFVAGADIEEIADLNNMNGRKFAERGQEVFANIENCPKPVIAAVNGYALGGGCELALACHIRIAADHAKFGQPEVNLGIIPGYGGTQRLPVLVGKGRAMELILTGDMIDADDAYRIGLVNHVVDGDELIETCEKMLRTILSRAGLAIAQAIDSINAVYTSDDGYQTEANAFGSCLKTDDFKEGTQAFLNKRKPIFTGK